MNQFILWGKPDCKFCSLAKFLIKNKGDIINQEYSVTEGDVSEGVIKSTKQELLNKNMFAKSYPQIWLLNEDGSEKYIGGFDDLTAWYNSKV
jgi:glutaredoxin